MKRKYMTVYSKSFNFTNKRLSWSTYLIRIYATYSKLSVCFEISLVVFMSNITTNHAITYTNILMNQWIKWNDDDDQIVQMDRRSHQSSMLMLLNKEELCSLSCAKDISIEHFLYFFVLFSVATTIPTTTPEGNWNRDDVDSDNVEIKSGSLDRYQFELRTRKCLVCLVQRLLDETIFHLTSTFSEPTTTTTTPEGKKRDIY